MTINVYISYVNPSGIGLTDGSITIIIQSVDPIPPDLATTFRYFTINNGSSFQVNGYLNYKTYTGLGAGEYVTYARMQPSGDFVPSYSIPQTITLLDGSEPVDPDALVYKDFYHGEICDKNGDTINIDIKRLLRAGDPDPVVADIIFSGEDPISVDYKDDGEYKQSPVIGSECVLRIKAVNGFQLSSLYTESETEWQVVLSGAWNWSGFVIPDSCSEPYSSEPYDVEIQATDRTGTLKDVLFQRDDLTNYIETYTDQEFLRLALLKTGLNLKMITAVTTREESMSTFGSNQSPLIRVYINGNGFINEDGVPVSTYEVVRSIVDRWSCRLFQWDGVWYLVNVLEQSFGTIAGTLFNEDGSYNSDVTVGNTVFAGGVDRDTQPVGTMSIAKGMKSSLVRYKYGYFSNEFYNGNFDIWTTNPTGLPDSWSAQGGVTVTTGTRQVDGVDTTDHYIIIADDSATGYAQNDTSAQVRATDKATISFDWYAPSAWNALGQYAYIQAIIYDVTNDRYFTGDGWTAPTVFGTFDVRYNRADLQSQVTTSIDIPGQDADYQLQFGIRNLDNRASYGADRYELQVNNTTISTGISNAVIKPGIGIEHKQTSYRNINYTRDAIEILHNDEPLDTQRTSGIVIDTDLGAGAGSVWYRPVYVGEEFLDRSLLFIIANSQLINHQKPYSIFEGVFMNAYRADVTPLSLISMDLIDDKQFIFLSGTFHLKEGHHDLKIAEALSETVSLKSIEQVEIYE
jgi:hypothetical protein